MDKNQKKMQKKNFFASRKMKYGAAATVLTAFFIAVVILLNVIVTAVDSKYRLYFDLTEDNLFTISEETCTMVEAQLKSYADANGEEAQIKFHFFAARDMLVEDEQKRWVVTLAESYSEKFSQISVEFHEDLTLHPDRYQAYKDKYGNDFNASAIIVSNEAVQNSFALTSFDQCLVYDADGKYVWAFQGEMKFNAALIRITSQKSPVAAFTVGHGESAPKELRQMLENCGFDIRDINLSKEEITDDISILIMVNPLYDIQAPTNDSEVAESTKISDYLNSYRSMMVIMSPTTPELPALDEILADFGVKVHRNQVVMDDISGIAGDSTAIYAEYNTNSEFASKAELSAPAITATLTALSAPPKTLCLDNAPIEILDLPEKENEATGAVLVSSSNSYVEKVTEEGKEKITGPFNLMTVTTRYTVKDNLDVYGHLLVIGSQSFTETEAFRNQFGNSDIVRNAIRLLSDQDIKVDVHYKVLEDYEIAVDSKTVYTYGIITALVIPVIIFAAGTVVYIRRKHM